MEIRSATRIVQKHASKIQKAADGLDSAGEVSGAGQQANSASTGMRSAYGKVKSICTDLHGHLNNEVEKINSIADAFESWDASAGD